MVTIKQILTTGAEHVCSDIHLTVGRPVEYRVQGDFVSYDHANAPIVQ